MKAAIRTILFSVALLAIATLSAQPMMPKGFVADWSDNSGLTWRETGTLPLPLKEAIASLKSALTKQGYVLRHDITGGAFGERHLFLWLKGDEEATVMVWPGGGKSTGLSWGVTNANNLTNILRKAVANGKEN